MTARLMGYRWLEPCIKWGAWLNGSTHMHTFWSVEFVTCHDFWYSCLLFLIVVFYNDYGALCKSFLTSSITPLALNAYMDECIKRRRVGHLRQPFVFCSLVHLTYFANYNMVCKVRWCIFFGEHISSSTFDMSTAALVNTWILWH